MLSRLQTHYCSLEQEWRDVGGMLKQGLSAGCQNMSDTGKQLRHKEVHGCLCAVIKRGFVSWRTWMEAIVLKTPSQSKHLDGDKNTLVVRGGRGERERERGGREAYHLAEVPSECCIYCLTISVGSFLHSAVPSAFLLPQSGPWGFYCFSSVKAAQRNVYSPDETVWTSISKWFIIYRYISS